jgi:putative membrane protein insertion efficiency factor
MNTENKTKIQNPIGSLFRFGKQVWDASIGRLLVLMLVGLIRAYQIMLSPRIGQVCRYYPTCSHYGLQAVKVHGSGKGTLLTAWRVLRCNPWATGGIDEVPTKGLWTNSKVIENSTNNDRQVIGA